MNQYLYGVGKFVYLCDAHYSARCITTVTLYEDRCIVYISIVEACIFINIVVRVWLVCMCVVSNNVTPPYANTMCLSI